VAVNLPRPFAKYVQTSARPAAKNVPNIRWIIVSAVPKRAENARKRAGKWPKTQVNDLLPLKQKEKQKWENRGCQPPNGIWPFKISVRAYTQPLE